MNTLEAKAIGAHVQATTAAGALAKREALEDGASEVYAELLAGAERMGSDRGRLDPEGLYIALLDLAARLLSEIADGAPEADGGWTFEVVQKLVPGVRELAGIELDGDHAFAEREREIRARYGVPAP